MSPIDRELERALAAHAPDLMPPADLLAQVENEARGIRRRRSALVGAAGLSVLAIAIAVPVATRHSDRAQRGTGLATQPPSATGSPSPSPVEASPVAGQSFADLAWPARGPRKDDADLAHRALASLTASFDDAHKPQQMGVKLLWAGPLGDGRVVAVLQTAEIRADSQGLFADFYVEDADGSGGRVAQRTEIRDDTPRGRAPAQLSAFVEGAEDFILVIGPPTTGQIEFTIDGHGYSTIDTAEGVGAFPLTQGPTAYRIRVLDRIGAVTYEGPIDLLSED